ncbi:MAG: hypothetical protein ABI036_00575 [Fibrobacteria bacterium]
MALSGPAPAVAGPAAPFAGASKTGADITEVDFEGDLVAANGAPIAGGQVKLLESDLTATTDGLGHFSLKGTIANGIVRRARLPGNLTLSYDRGRLTVRGVARGRLQAEWITARGGVRKVTPVAGAPVANAREASAPGAGGGEGALQIDLDALSDRARGVHWLRLTSDAGQATFRFERAAAGHGILFGGPSGRSGKTAAENARLSGLAKITAGSEAGRGFLLEAGAAGFLGKRFAQSQAMETGLTLSLLPATATLKERIQDFIGAGNTFKLAYLKLEAPASKKYLLYYTDFAEMTGDTMPQHVFADSRGPASSPYGAFAPSWAPDGRSLAYETGWENLTTPISRIYIQPLGGARRDGPVYPATNPRWWTDGRDTALIWCSSGKQDGWADTTSATYRQKVVDDSLSGSPETLAKGSYNAGLSPDGRYLATAYRFALMADLQSKTRKFLHVYPGHAPAADASSTDSLQACNGSVSQDPAHPSRMLFLDFGVPDEPAYPNLVRPGIYAQHRMILIGDFASAAAGGIVDFIDSPAAELAVENTWDDPEWTNQADFAVATTRDPDGDKTKPAEPLPTQPDIYLIKLSTRESVKVFSGSNQVLPAAWIGSKN